MNWINDHSDKLLLLTLFLIMFGTVLHMTHHQADAAIITWGREECSTVLGGLLMLITGHALAKKD